MRGDGEDRSADFCVAQKELVFYVERRVGSEGGANPTGLWLQWLATHPWQTPVQKAIPSAFLKNILENNAL